MHSAVFTALVVMTGGCYPALDLVSSNVFGADIMSSGLTHFELRQLIKIKLWNSVLLENVPQLICQGLYALSTTESTVSSTVLFAATASLLSVIATVLTYFLDQRHDENELVAVQYYLTTKCQRQTVPFGASPVIGQIGGKKKRKGNELRDDEKRRIERRRGLTWKLGRALNQFWNIPDGAIEVGHTMLTQKGMITHIVHFMKREDITAYSAELFGDDDSVPVTPLLIVRQFYESKRYALCEIFRSHFGLSNEFDVTFHDRRGLKKNTLRKSVHAQHLTVNSNHSSTMSSLRALSGSGTVTGANEPSESTEDKNSQFQRALRVFLDGEDIAGLNGMDFADKKAEIMEIVGGMMDGMDPSKAEAVVVSGDVDSAEFQFAESGMVNQAEDDGVMVEMVEMEEK